MTIQRALLGDNPTEQPCVVIEHLTCGQGAQRNKFLTFALLEADTQLPERLRVFGMTCVFCVCVRSTHAQCYLQMKYLQVLSQVDTLSAKHNKV